MLNPIAVGLTVSACMLGGVLLGLFLNIRLPDEHLGSESRDTVKLGIGLVATMTALVLGLVCASAKDSFDDLSATIRQSSADILTLDRALARYGPETLPIRAGLKVSIAKRMEKTWPKDSSEVPVTDPVDGTIAVETLVGHIRALTPADESQRWLQGRALDLAEKLLEARWLTFEGIRTPIPTPFLVVLSFWLTMTFLSFGLFAPRNGTVLAVLAICALSVGSAVFLILEMDGPFEGVIKVSSAPVEYAHDRMGR